MIPNTTALGHTRGLRKHWFPKVKTGCIPCKRRKVKCDEQRPSCLQCTRNHLQCARFDDPYRPEISTIGRDVSILATPSSRSSFVGSFHIRDILYLIPILANYGGGDTLGVNSADSYEFLRAQSRELASYVFHLPGRVGVDITLDSASQSVAAILRDVYLYIQSESSAPFCVSSTTLATYMRALRILQEALYDRQRSMSAEVLCATEMLCVFECLRAEDASAALRHSQGAADIIKYRGPRRFTTDFERSLLTSQLPSMFTRYAYSNTACFLDHADWVDVLHCSILSEFHTVDRAPFSLVYYINALSMVTTIVQCFYFVMGQDMLSSDQLQQQQRTLLNELNAKSKTVQEWQEDMVRYRPTFLKGNSMGNAQVMQRWHDYMDMTIATILGYKRFYIALGGQSSHGVEIQVQEMARNLLLGHDMRQKSHVQRGASLIVRPMCKSIRETADEWLTFASREPHKDDVDAIQYQPAKLMSSEMCHRWTMLAGFSTYDVN